MDSSSRTVRHKQPAPWKQIVDEETELSQRTLRSTEPPRNGTLTPFQQSLTPAQFKVLEIDMLKKTTLAVMSRFHGLQLEYTDWFKRQLRSFIGILKSVQTSNRGLAPEQIKTLRHFRQLYDIALSMSNHSKLMPRFDKLEVFLVFWKKFTNLMEDLESEVIKPLDEFCDSVSSLRQPEVKTQIDHLCQSLRHACSEEFDFTACHNEKDNLYTYSLMTSEQEFLGLVGYIPHLIDYATKICYMTKHIHMEQL